MQLQLLQAPRPLLQVLLLQEPAPGLTQQKRGFLAPPPACHTRRQTEPFTHKFLQYCSIAGVRPQPAPHQQCEHRTHLSQTPVAHGKRQPQQNAAALMRQLRISQQLLQTRPAFLHPSRKKLPLPVA